MNRAYLLDGFSGPIDPQADICELIQQQIVRANHARRQLEQHVTTFWFNHFNTERVKNVQVSRGVFPQCQAPGVPQPCDPSYPNIACEAASLLQNSDIGTFRAPDTVGQSGDPVIASNETFNSGEPVGPRRWLIATTDSTQLREGS